MLEKVKNLIDALCGYDEGNEALLEFALADAAERASFVCNSDSATEKFENEIAKYAAGTFLKLLKNSGKGNAEIREAAVKSISEGDISVTYEKMTSDEERLDELISQLCGSLDRLVGSRRLIW